MTFCCNGFAELVEDEIIVFDNIWWVLANDNSRIFSLEYCPRCGKKLDYHDNS